MGIHHAYNVSGFYTLPRRAIPLEPWQHRVPDPTYRTPRTKANIPERTDFLIQALLDFARYVGLESIPASTITSFQENHYLKYCFIGLIDDHQSMYSHRSYRKGPKADLSRKAEKLRERWKECLLDPNKLTDRDLQRGLASYINNFVEFMPGGEFRQIAPSERGYVKKKLDVMRVIDEVLAWNGFRDQAERLGAAARKELAENPQQYPARIAYFKFCLEIFHHLVEEHGFKTIDLWG